METGFKIINGALAEAGVAAGDGNLGQLQKVIAKQLGSNPSFTPRRVKDPREYVREKLREPLPPELEAIVLATTRAVIDSLTPQEAPKDSESEPSYIEMPSTISEMIKVFFATAKHKGRAFTGYEQNEIKTSVINALLGNPRFLEGKSERRVDMEATLSSAQADIAWNVIVRVVKSHLQERDTRRRIRDDI